MQENCLLHGLHFQSRSQITNPELFPSEFAWLGLSIIFSWTIWIIWTPIPISLLSFPSPNFDEYFPAYSHFSALSSSKLVDTTSSTSEIFKT